MATIGSPHTVITASPAHKEALCKFANDHSELAPKLYSTKGFDGTELITLIVVHGPDWIDSLALLIAAMNAEKIEINVDLPNPFSDHNTPDNK